MHWTGVRCTVCVATLEGVEMWRMNRQGNCKSLIYGLWLPALIPKHTKASCERLAVPTNAQIMAPYHCMFISTQSSISGKIQMKTFFLVDTCIFPNVSKKNSANYTALSWRWQHLGPLDSLGHLFQTKMWSTSFDHFNLKRGMHLWINLPKHNFFFFNGFPFTTWVRCLIIETMGRYINDGRSQKWRNHCSPLAIAGLKGSRQIFVPPKLRYQLIYHL